MPPPPQSSHKPSKKPTLPSRPNPALLPTCKPLRQATALDNHRYPTGPLKPRLVAAFTIDHPSQAPFDSGLDQLISLMQHRSIAAAAAAAATTTRPSKHQKQEYERLDNLIREAVAGFSVRIELQPPVWMDPQYALAALVWAFEMLQGAGAECGELKGMLGKVVLGAREIEDLAAPLVGWRCERPW
ncbi:MAG: hypothetical protein L6R36_007158 [Xanthoria steineri]|nr:MAG: hypothetical protein L6R36_007158 [Xanthoria steineri]